MIEIQGCRLDVLDEQTGMKTRKLEEVELLWCLCLDTAKREGHPIKVTKWTVQNDEIIEAEASTCVEGMNTELSYLYLQSPAHWSINMLMKAVICQSEDARTTEMSGESMKKYKEYPCPIPRFKNQEVNIRTWLWILQGKDASEVEQAVRTYAAENLCEGKEILRVLAVPPAYKVNEYCVIEHIPIRKNNAIGKKDKKGKETRKNMDPSMFKDDKRNKQLSAEIELALRIHFERYLEPVCVGRYTVLCKLKQDGSRGKLAKQLFDFDHLAMKTLSGNRHRRVST